MEPAKPYPALDRRLFAPLRSSWLEGVAGSFRGLNRRLQARMSRGKCEARVRALAPVRRDGPRVPNCDREPTEI